MDEAESFFLPNTTLNQGAGRCSGWVFQVHRFTSILAYEALVSQEPGSHGEWIPLRRQQTCESVGKQAQRIRTPWPDVLYWPSIEVGRDLATEAGNSVIFTFSSRAAVWLPLVVRYSTDSLKTCFCETLHAWLSSMQ